MSDKKGPHIRITSPTGKPCDTKIEINGEPVHSCYAIEAKIDVETPTVVILHLYPESLEIDMKGVKIEKKEKFREKPPKVVQPKVEIRKDSDPV